MDATLIPTGELKPVQGTPFDFRKPTRSARASRPTTNRSSSARATTTTACSTAPAATLKCWPRGRAEDRPDPGSADDRAGLQFYTGNFLDGTNIGKGGKAYDSGTASAWSRSTSRLAEPAEVSLRSVLKPGQVYRTRSFTASVSQSKIGARTQRSRTGCGVDRGVPPVRVWRRNVARTRRRGRLRYR